MAECIYFEGAFELDSPKEHTITTPSGKVWHIENLWLTENDEVVQRVSIKNYDAEDYYYADLEVSCGENYSVNKIRRSVRMLSSHIWFKLLRREYDKELGSNSVNTTDDQCGEPVIYTYKLTLTPVVPFNNVKVPFGKVKLLKKRTQIDSLKGVKELSSDLKKLLDTQEGCDVVFHWDKVIKKKDTKGKKEEEIKAHIKAHKTVLVGRSKFFSRLFDKIREDPKTLVHEFKGLNVRIVNADNCDDSILALKLTNTDFENFQILINFMYNGEYKPKGFQEAKDLFEIARVFEVRDLQEKCLLKLKSEKSVNAQFELYHFSLKHQCEDLKREVMDHVASEIKHRRMKEEWRVEKWMTLFERYQKPFYLKVKKDMNEHMPIGVFDPSDHPFNDQDNSNDIDNANVENNNIGNVYAENNDEVGCAANECEQLNNRSRAESVNYFENLDEFVEGASADYGLYATAYFDTRKNPENFDDGRVTNDNEKVIKSTNDIASSDNLNDNKSISNENSNGNGVSNETNHATHFSEIKKKSETEKQIIVRDINSNNRGAIVSSGANDTRNETHVISSGASGTSSEENITNNGANGSRGEANVTSNGANGSRGGSGSSSEISGDINEANNAGSGANGTTCGAGVFSTEASVIRNGENVTSNGASGTSSKAIVHNSGASVTSSGANGTSSGANGTSSGANGTSSGASVTSSGASVTSSGADGTSNAANGTSNAASVTTNAASVTTNKANVTSGAASGTSSAASGTSKEENEYDDSVFNDDPEIRRILKCIRQIFIDKEVP